jgi:hypothetical protein
MLCKKFFQISKPSLLNVSTINVPYSVSKLLLNLRALQCFFPYTHDQFTQKERKYVYLRPGPARMTMKARTLARQASMRLNQESKTEVLWSAVIGTGDCTATFTSKLSLLSKKNKQLRCFRALFCTRQWWRVLLSPREVVLLARPGLGTPAVQEAEPPAQGGRSPPSWERPASLTPPWPRPQPTS